MSTQPYDEAIEALRRAVCKLPRFSFLLDVEGGVRRVEDATGRWIEFDQLHAMFDPEAMDAILANEQATSAINKAKDEHAR